MPTFEHYQQLKTANALPGHDGVGACLTCKYWQVEAYRDESIVPKVALCIHPMLAPFALIVTGASACNKWAEKPDKEPEAAAYAERYEEDKGVQREKARLAGPPPGGKES